MYFKTSFNNIEDAKAELKSAQKLRYVNPFKGASRKAHPVQH